jgi:phosphatidate phosphatase APP1
MKKITKLNWFVRGLYKRIFGKKEIIKVEPFVAFGNEQKVFFKGRVISPYKDGRPKAKNNWLLNILATIRRYSNSSIPYALVQITFQNQNYQVTTDEDGVFELLVDASRKQIGNKEVASFQIIDPSDIQECLKVEREVVRFNKSIGIISDIDDTVLISHSTMIGKKFWLSVSKNAYTRRPFPGVSHFYQKLSQNGENPVFYVSSSDWSLFDLIKDFLMYRDIPIGPLLLKDRHINIKNIWKSGGGDHSHKFDKICFLLDLFPQMKFHLIGDSGQHDPEIYADVIRRYPDRICSVFIRIVRKLDDSRANAIVDQVNGVQFNFVKDTNEALSIAKSQQFIS